LLRSAARKGRLGSPSREIDSAFEHIVELRAGAPIVAADPFIFGRREKIVALA
jgi:hypothetical protein